jgi:hypothetical protein
MSEAWERVAGFGRPFRGRVVQNAKRAKNEGSGSHDWESREFSSALPIWTPQPLQEQVDTIQSRKKCQLSEQVSVSRSEDFQS